ncbi:MAG: hypothetical protein QME45_05150 [Clostridiales bacterium]|nr:hypothetical protein [Clostridiales bacterium]
MFLDRLLKSRVYFAIYTRERNTCESLYIYISISNDNIKYNREKIHNFHNTMQRVYQELEREGVINTKRGMGSFATEDESRVRNIRDSMARELIENFIKEMNGLGFAYKEIASMIEIYCREEMGTNE